MARPSGHTPLGTPHGFGDDARSRFIRQRPPDRALRWVERAAGGSVVGVRALRGGSSSAIHSVRLSRGDARDTVILRRYVLDWLNEEEPDIAEREARVLRVLERCDVATPELIALDPDGAATGTPAVLMTRVPGRLDWDPRDLEPWLRRLAAVLPPIHGTPITDEDAVQPFQPYEPASWDPPAWLRDPRLWHRAVALFHAPPLDTERFFIHRDHHPGNVLWRRGRVTGVVDWQSASIGPRAVDVYHCRANLHDRFGLEVADRFVVLWEQEAQATYHPWAEAVMLVGAIGGTWARTPSMRAEMEDLLSRRLAELS